MQLFYGTRHRINVIGTLLPVFVGGETRYRAG